MDIDFHELAHQNLKNLVPYQPGKTIESVKNKTTADSIIKLASNENPFGASPKAIEAMQATLNTLALYPEHAPTAAATIAASLKLPVSHITLGCGSENVIQMLIQAFNRPGRHMLIPELAFSAYKINALALNAAPVIVPAVHHHHDLDNIIEQCTDDTALIFIDNPNNPMGHHFTHSEIETVLAKIPKTTLLVLDEAYFEFGQRIEEYPNSVRLLEKYPNLVILRTFSKVHGLAGLRIGYGISHPDVANILNKVRLPFNLSTTAIEAAIAAVSDHDFIEHTLDENDYCMTRLKQAISECGFDYFPTIANFITFDLKEDSQRFYQFMLEHGIIVRTLHPYQLPNYIRISTGTRQQTEKAIEVLKLYANIQS